MSDDFKRVWRDLDGDLRCFKLFPDGKMELITGWAVQPGSQDLFLKSNVFETLYEGTRGPGKTDALLMDFAQHCGPDKRTPDEIKAGKRKFAGWGSEWRGIIFRRTYPELKDIVEKSLRWFSIMFPTARYNRSEHFWTFETGEQLLFRHFLRDEDYWSYHGHAYPFIGWEELCTWPRLSGYKSMFSCARSTVAGIPIKVRATTNPYGKGHNAVKARFRLPIPEGSLRGPIITDSYDEAGNLEPPRMAIRGRLAENRILLHADPDYEKRIIASADNPQMVKAWVKGDWNITAGGMFDDLWNPKVHVIPNLTAQQIPHSWKIDRAYDHGQSAPFSVGWWAESNGEPIRLPDGRVIGGVRGDLIHVWEWYGWNGRPEDPAGIRMLSTDIAQGIIDREEDWGIRGRVRAGPADTSIFDEFEAGKSVAGDMLKKGVRWERADKSPGSRKQGWQQLRKLLSGASPKDGVREEPGIFICQRCTQFIRTFPVLTRSDKDMDDVDTDVEDHIGDMTRYRARARNRQIDAGHFGVRR